MQFRLIPALLVFLGSYFPLAIIMAIQDIKIFSWNSDICINFHECHLPEFHNPWLSLLIFIITGICLILISCIFKKLRYTYKIEIKETKLIPTELINYSFPYIVSFMGVDYESTEKIVGLVIFLVCSPGSCGPAPHSNQTVPTDEHANKARGVRQNSASGPDPDLLGARW